MTRRLVVLDTLLDVFFPLFYVPGKNLAARIAILQAAPLSHLERNSTLRSSREVSVRREP